MVSRVVRPVGVVLSLAFGVAAYAGMAGTKHDFTSQGWSGGSICAPCHTPHNANTAITGAPLWAHATTAATYTLYSSPTMNATVTQPTNYASKLCLSCHDGTVALDSFGGKTGTSFISAANKTGTDLRGTHPIGIVFNAALATADKGLFNPDTKTIPTGDTVTKGMLFGTGALECASCHDVHNTVSAGNTFLLRVTATGSALCLTCHNK